MIPTVHLEAETEPPGSGNYATVRYALRLLAAGVVLSLGSTASASVFPVEGPKSALRIHAARFVIATGAGQDTRDWWTVAFEVSGRGSSYLAVPFERGSGDAATPELLDESGRRALDELDFRTAPRFVDEPALDPCRFGPRRYGRYRPPSSARPWPYGPEGWEPEWPRVETKPLEKSTLRVVQGEVQAAWVRDYRDHMSEGTGIALARAPAVALLEIQPDRERRWTPPLRIKRPGSVRGSLSILPLRTALPPGREQRIDVFTLASGRGLTARGPVADLPDRLSLPEITFEQPFDTEQAAIRKRLAADKSLAAVREYGSPNHRLSDRARELLAGPSMPSSWATRLVTYQGARTEARIELRRDPSQSRLEVVWLVHRPWRGPLKCYDRYEYLSNVARYQLAAHQVWSAMTGRRLELLVNLSRERGFLLEPFGQIPQAAESKLQPVVIDHGAWK